MKEDNLEEEKENFIDTNENENKEQKQNELIILGDNQKEKLKDDNLESQELEINEKNKKRFTYFENDPYLDSNCISKFIMYWAYKIINISTKTKMKKEYLGKIGDAHDSKHFNDQISYIWENKGYKNIKKYSLILCVFRANIKMIFFSFFSYFN